MKLNEYTLIETISQEQQIDKIAHSLSSIVYIMLEKIITTKSLPLILENPFEIGQMSNIFNPAVFGELYSEFKDIYILLESKRNNTTQLAEYGSGKHPELGKLRYIKCYHWVNDHTLPEKHQLYTSFVHELRHALDESLSDGKGVQHTRSKHTTPDRDFEAHNALDGMDVSAGTYLRYPTEINARISQAMLEIKNHIHELFNLNKTENIPLQHVNMMIKQYLNNIIPAVMDEYHLIHIFNKDSKKYRRIFNRLLLYSHKIIKDKNETK